MGAWDECDRDGREQESVRELHQSAGDESRDEHASAFSLLVGVVFRLGGLREEVFGERCEEASISGGVTEGECCIEMRQNKHPFVKDAVDRIVKNGNSELLLELAKRVGNATPSVATTDSTNVVAMPTLRDEEVPVQRDE